MKQRIWVLGVVWLVFSLFSIGMPEKIFSEAENRYLQQKPKLKVEAVLDGTYMEDFEAWMSDQLVLRDELVALKASVDQVTGRSDSGGVYLGRDGYLLEMFTKIEEKRWERNVDETADFLKQMEARGVEGHFLMVPTAAYVLEEKLPAFAPELNQEELMEKLQERIPGFIPVAAYLKQVAAAAEDSDGEQLYYRTDHHWTSLGAYYAYAAFCRETGRAEPVLSDYETSVLSTEFYGTGYAKAGLYHLKPDTMMAMHRKEQSLVTVDYGTGEPETTLYDRTFLEKRDKYRVFLKGNYPLTKITTAVKNGKKLLLIKDSYANIFVQFLTEEYEEIHLIDLRYFKQEPETYVTDQGITEVLFLYQIKNFAEDTNIRL